MSKSSRFYLACFRDNVGGNVAFHGKCGSGYTTGVEKAQEFTLAQAQKEWEGARQYDQPICADYVDALTVYKTDCQSVPIESVLKSDTDCYVAYQKARYEGNDLYWLSQDTPNLDFSKAQKFSLSQLVPNPSLVYLPFQIVDEIKRKTFSYHLYNPRKMVQAAGLIMPEHIKMARRRLHYAGTGKTRSNCSSCGEIRWTLNPYCDEVCQKC
jgi:ribosomal protein L32